MSGIFITLEGLDGCGKTTQARLLTAWLQSRGLQVCLTRQPGGTPTGDRLRTLLLDSSSGPLAPMTELALMFGDRAQSLHEVIRPALALGKIVLCDRYTDSTEAYQGAGRGLGTEVVLAAQRIFCGDTRPDLTLYIQVETQTALARARRRLARAREGEIDEGRFERETSAFFERVAAGYAEIAVREPERVRKINGNRGIEQVHRDVVDIVQSTLHARHAVPATLPPAP